MPWDVDADVQVTEADMYYLAAYHNMTTYYYKYGDMKEGRYFQLEINPSFTHREQDDTDNVIDGRWIDMKSGLFIDITAARYNLDHEEGEGILYDKYGHEYRVRHIAARWMNSCDPWLISRRTHMSFLYGTQLSRECLARSPTVIKTCCKLNTGRKL